MRFLITFRTLVVPRLALPALAAAALLAACDRNREPTAPIDSPVGGLQADLVGTTLSYLTAQLFALDPLIPDGSPTLYEALPFGHTIHVVDRDNKNSWKIQVGATGTVTFDNELTCDPSQGPPLPLGALHLVVTTGDQGARLRATRYHRTYLRDLTRLDYHACDEINNGQQWPYILLTVDWDGNNTIDDQIFFEPAYQNPVDGGTCGIGSAQSPPVLDQWDYWDALRTDPATGEFRACYWALSSPVVGGVGTVGCGPGIFVCSLSNYIAQHPTAAIVNLDGNHGGVQIVHGFASPGDVFDGWVDAFTIGKDINGSSGQSQNSTITYDYEHP